jgi:hypothetical protein
MPYIPPPPPPIIINAPQPEDRVINVKDLLPSSLEPVQLSIDNIKNAGYNCSGAWNEAGGYYTSAAHCLTLGGFDKNSVIVSEIRPFASNGVNTLLVSQSNPQNDSFIAIPNATPETIQKTLRELNRQSEDNGVPKNTTDIIESIKKGDVYLLVGESYKNTPDNNSSSTPNKAVYLLTAHQADVVDGRVNLRAIPVPVHALLGDTTSVSYLENHYRNEALARTSVGWSGTNFRLASDDIYKQLNIAKPEYSNITAINSMGQQFNHSNPVAAENAMPPETLEYASRVLNIPKTDFFHPGQNATTTIGVFVETQETLKDFANQLETVTAEDLERNRFHNATIFTNIGLQEDIQQTGNPNALNNTQQLQALQLFKFDLGR